MPTFRQLAVDGDYDVHHYWQTHFSPLGKDSLHVHTFDTYLNALVASVTQRQQYQHYAVYTKLSALALLTSKLKQNK